LNFGALDHSRPAAVADRLGAGGIARCAFRASPGFTMVEIAISLGIIAFALVAIIHIMPFAMGVQRENREETIINQETTVLLNAIRNGEQGLDDLTNYVVAITNTQTWFPYPSGRPATVVYGYTLTNSTAGGQPMGQAFLITNGFRIVGLLSTPKYWPLYNTGKQGQAPVFEGFYSNHVAATVRAMSGSASDKAPQSNASVEDMAFAYRVICEVMPYGSGNPLTSYSSAWNSDWTNYTSYPNAADWYWRSNYFRYAMNLQEDLNEVRLLFRWPALPNGRLGTGWQAVRAVTAGPVQPFPNAGTDPAYTLYFVQPKTFVRAQ
jgi:type II secretory pathway pseudopilin PulG